MYLADKKTNGKFSYIIRESLNSDSHYIHRDLFDLGEDPRRFIHYPGGKGYFYDARIEEALIRKGVKFDPDDLDQLFFEFLDPEIQRVIMGFDRGYRAQKKRPHQTVFKDSLPIHIFDKRRFHYLRFGHSQQRNIDNVPEKIFQSLRGKSRDELEHYFKSEERRLGRHEIGLYISTIFQLNDFTTNNHHDLLTQTDAYFIDRLCRLNSDTHFLAGESKPHGLYEHLIKYTIIYFDFNPAQHNSHWQYIRDFINRHRAYRPPVKTMAEIKEAEVFFGHSWKDLKHMDRVTLTRVYRQSALKHHPDQGGSDDHFQRLTKYYKALLAKKPKEK